MAASVGTCGALELKRAYQTHLGWGLVLGVTLHMGAVLWLAYFLSPVAVVVPPKPPVETAPVRMIPLPKLGELLPQPSPLVQDAVANSDIGLPIAVSDEEMPMDYIAPELKPTVWSPGRETGEGGGPGIPDGTNLNGVMPVEPEIFPTPTDFIAVESMPVIVKQVAPVYPEIAQLTGREGRLIVRALVDRDGIVRKAEIVRSSGVNVGFDEAAIEAALLCRYKPAIQNGRPVAIWVTYPVEFRLK